MGDVAVYAALFFTAFVAATIFPMQSEALLVGLLIKSDYALWLLIAVASIGNIMGSCVNWWLGRSIERYKDHAWFPVKEKSLEKAQTYYSRYGRWSLFLSWVPVIGDPITVMAGVLKERFVVFLTLVGIAKTGRYLFIAYLVT